VAISRQEGERMSSNPKPSSPWLLGLLLGGLLLALGGLAAQLLSSGRGLAALPLYDFVEYWAAGRLLLHGQNPYDPEAIERLQRQVSPPSAANPGFAPAVTAVWTTGVQHHAITPWAVALQSAHLSAVGPEPILMWNPPWALPLVLPLGLFEEKDVHTAHVLWLLFHLLVLLGSADLLWRVFGGDPERRWLAWVLTLTFVPTWMALLAGQISPLVLLGAAGFLAALRAGRDNLAGAATVLLALKPHLTLLFWLALLLWALQQGRWRILLGGALTGVAATSLALAFDPDLLGHYWHTLTTSPPAQYRSPTLGYLLRLVWGEEHFRLQFLPVLLGLLFFVPWFLRYRRCWDWNRQLPLLLLISFVTASYGAWPFDLVVLLVPVLGLAVAVRKERRLVQALAGAVYLLMNAGAVMLVSREAEYLWFIWMAPALLAGYLAFELALRYTYQPQAAGLPPGLANSNR
jgi:hypothetical protein